MLNWWYAKLFFSWVLIKYTCSHSRLMEPVARSSAWRLDSRFPVNENDMQMNCGGFHVQWIQNNGKCGICGENYAAVKKYEKGRIHYRGINVNNYTEGQTFNVYVKITANHLGWFEFRLCKIDGWSTDANQECLDKTLLKDKKGDTRFKIPSNLFEFRKRLVLPKALFCDHCVFQDNATGENCLGCGPQEQFYGCSDIGIKQKQSTDVEK